MREPESATNLAGDVVACLTMLVRECSRDGTRIFYLARDAWLPWKLLPEAGDYVSVSRQALRTPLLAADPERAANWAVDRVAVNSVESVLARFHASAESFSGELKAAGFSRDTWVQVQGRRGRNQIKDFIRSEAFRPQLEFLRMEHEEKVVRYLSSKGLLSNAGGLVVDVGWNGSCQKHLQEYRTKVGVDASRLGGIYLGLQSRSGFAAGTRLESVWEPGGRGGQLFDLGAFYVLAEMFLTANHGGVMGYAEKGGQICPVLADHDVGGYLIKWGLEAFQKDILSRAASRMGDSASDFARLAQETAVEFERFAANPSLEEASRFGEWPACVDPAHQCAHALAPRMRYGDMWNYFVHRKPQPVLWREGAAARLKGLPRLAFQAANGMDLLAGGMRRLVSQLRR